MSRQSLQDTGKKLVPPGPLSLLPGAGFLCIHRGDMNPVLMIMFPTFTSLVKTFLSYNRGKILGDKEQLKGQKAHN